LRFVGFAKQGQLLVTGSWMDHVQAWDVQTGKRIYRLNLKKKLAFIEALALSPDGKTLAIAGSGYYVRLFDVATGQDWALLGQPDTRASCLAFSSDGITLVSGGAGFVHVFKVPKRSRPGRMPRSVW
jgi:WD40 repeat protein